MHNDLKLNHFNKYAVQAITLIVFLVVIFLTLHASLVKAAEITVQVTDNNNKPLEDAVVYVEGSAKIAAASTLAAANVSQKNKTFMPLVSVIQTGSSINFPNYDSVTHHVYSFSPAKKFELKLYSGVPTAPVIFDKAGTVVLGCNIHDNMLAFVYIVDTPYFSKTNSSGMAKLVDIPDGNYHLKVWHYALQKENVPYDEAIDVKGTEKKATVKIEINGAALVK